MAPSSAAHIVQQADAQLASLLHLADALPEFAVSPAFGGETGDDGGTVTDVLARVLAEQEALAAGASTQPSPHLGETEKVSQHAHRPYGELRRLVEERHAALRETAIAGPDESVDAIEQLGKRYEWAQTVLGQCAL